MKIPLIDLVAQYRTIRDEIDRAIRDVLERGNFVLGENVAAFEEGMAAYLGVGYAIGVASGTDALVLTLRACGIGPGDEVVVPCYTFFATAEAVSHCGARPVFVDIDPKTYCLDVSQVASRITGRTKAIIPVHLFGHPADMDPIMDLARGRGIRVIEDNAQALGAEYGGRKTGSIGDAGCLSFFPSKNLGGYGDGGMVVTTDLTLAEAVRKLRNHGWRRKYFPETVGWNSRLDEIQAAILRVKLRYLDAWNTRRRGIAVTYSALLGDSSVVLPWEAPHVKHVYHLYLLRVKERDIVQAHLRSLDIASAIYYPVPLHLVDPYRPLGFQHGDFPHSEQAAQETLAIPLYPEMKDDQIEAVASAVREALG